MQLSKLGKDEVQVRIRVELQLPEQPAEASVRSTTPRSAGWYPFPGASLLAPQSPRLLLLLCLHLPPPREGARECCAGARKN